MGVSTTDKPTNRLERVVIDGIVVAAVVYLLPFLLPWSSISWNDDWTQIFAFQSYLYDSILSHGELPMRAHWLGSGFPLIAHPEYPILTPFTATVLLLGPIGGTKVNVVLITLLGVKGMWRCARETLQLDAGPAVYGTLLFLLCGWLPAILHSGNYPEIYFLWFPWLAHLVLREKPFDGALVGAAVVGALMLLDGHLNSVCCFVFLGIWACMRSRKTILRTAVFGILTLLLAAFKLVPTVALLLVEDRSIDLYQAVETVPFQWRAFAGFQAETTGFALGPLPWILAFASLRWWRQTWSLLVAFVLSILLYFGPDSPIDLFWALTRLPVLASLDAPAKYFSFFVGFFAIGLGMITLQRIPAHWKRWAIPLCILITAIPLIVQNRPALGHIFTEPDVATADVPFQQFDTDYFVADQWTGPEDQRPDLYRTYRAGLGVLRWEDNFQLPVHTEPAWTILPDGSTQATANHKGEVALFSGNGDASLETITANQLVVQYTATQADKVLVNQHYDTDWQCTPTVPVDHKGLLAIPVEAGAGSITCHFRSSSFRLGAMISLIALLGALLGVWFQRRRTKATA